MTARAELRAALDRYDEAHAAGNTPGMVAAAAALAGTAARLLEETPQVVTILVRDPDGDVYESVFVDGVYQEPTGGPFVIDPGRGWDWEDWKQSRDYQLERAAQYGEQVVTHLRDCFDDPPEGWRYIHDKPEGEPWV
jgi:hypothetical protein